MTINQEIKQVKEEKYKSKIDWAWEFYSLLGYRIVEDKQEEISLNNYMNELVKIAKLETLENIKKMILKEINEKGYRGIIKDILKDLIGEETRKIINLEIKYKRLSFMRFLLKWLRG